MIPCRNIGQMKHCALSTYGAKQGISYLRPNRGGGTMGEGRGWRRDSGFYKGGFAAKLVFGGFRSVRWRIRLPLYPL